MCFQPAFTACVQPQQHGQQCCLASLVWALTINRPYFTPTPSAVWYEIYTLSRPGSWITAVTHPLLRAFQRKFAADSMAAMQREMLRP